MSYFQSLRHALFASRIKAIHLRSQRCRGAVAKSLESRLEPLEKRIALDASGDAAFQRPLLTQNQSIYLYAGEDASQGPLPVVFGKSDIVGNDADSFVVTGVVNGVVEKWDAASKTWQDVSTKPTSSHPLQLLRHLSNRLVRPTDRVRWVPATGTRTAAPSHAFTSLAWNTGSETDSGCPERTVTYVSSSGPASVSVNGDPPVSTASQTTEITCDCGCAPKPDLENLKAEELIPGTFSVTWDKAPDANGNIELIKTQKLKTATKRFETSDLVWHDGLQRFFAVSDDGGILATFTYDGAGIDGDGFVQQYWDLTSQLKDKFQKLGIAWTDNARSFEGLTFKQSDSVNDTVIYIGTEFEQDTDNRIIEFDFAGSFNSETGEWNEAKGSITNVFDLKDVMPGADDDNNKKAGLEALTFVPDTTGGVFYVGQQYDGEILKLKLNSDTGTVEDVGRVIFDDLPRSGGFVDLSAMQYVELKGEPFLLALFGEGFNNGDDNNRENELPVRISIAKLKDLDPTDKGLINTQATVGLNWKQTSDLVKSDWPSLYGLNKEGRLSQDFGVMGPEGIAYFEYNGEKRIAIASDPGDHQLLDGEQVGRVKIFKGFDLEAPQVAYSYTVTDESGNKAIYPQTFFNHVSVPTSPGHTYTVEVHSAGRWADGTRGDYQPASSVSFTTEDRPSPILGSSPATGFYTENYVTSFGDLDGWTVEDRDINGQLYASGNVELDSGGLRLKVTADEKGTPVSGRVIKNEGWKYGLFVFETSQIPKALVTDYPWPTMDISLKHLWPALWTLGTVDENPDLETGNMWPLRGEIDVMETVRAIDSRPDYTSRIMVASDAFFVPPAPQYQRQSLPGDGDPDIKTNGISTSREGSYFRSGWDRPHTFAVDWYPVVNAETGQEIDWRFDFYQDVGVNDEGELVQRRFWSRGDLLDTEFPALPAKTYSLQQLIKEHNAKVDTYQDGLNPYNGDKVTFKNIVDKWDAHRPVLNVAVGNHENGTGQWEWNTPWQSEINGVKATVDSVLDDGTTLILPPGSLTGLKKKVTIAPARDERLWELTVDNVDKLAKWDLVTGEGIPNGTKIFGFSNSHPNKIKLITPEYADEISVAVDAEIVFKKDIREWDVVAGDDITSSTRVSWIHGDSITLDKAVTISGNSEIKFKRFAAHLPTDGSADMVVRSFAHYTRPAVKVDPLPLTLVIRHGHDWKENAPHNYGERADKWDENLEDGDIASQWLYNGTTIDPISDGGTLGLPKVITKNGDSGNFRLNDQGTAEANSFAKVLPELVDSINGLPIRRIMVDSYARTSDAKGTPNPLDTVLPFILDTQTSTQTHLDIDLVVRANNTLDADAWNHDNVRHRLKPLVGEGSVLIASTAQGIWAKDDPRKDPPNILDMLNILYGLDHKKVIENGTEVEYLESKSWLKGGQHTEFDDVREADKGRQIYVYGELDGDLSNGFEVAVYHQDVLKNTFELGF